MKKEMNETINKDVINTDETSEEILKQAVTYVIIDIGTLRQKADFRRALFDTIFMGVKGIKCFFI